MLRISRHGPLAATPVRQPGAQHGRGVEDDDDRRPGAAAEEREKAFLGALGIRPIESRAGHGRHMERGQTAIEVVEVAHELLQALCSSPRSTSQSSVASSDHSRHWPNSPPMKSSFLPGCVHIQA